LTVLVFADYLSCYTYVIGLPIKFCARTVQRDM
jgi:hypothetical protein